MAEKGNGKSNRVANSQVGVVGDNAHVEGGIHFHHYESEKQDADQREQSEPKAEITTFDASEAVDILHLSDLHFGADENSDFLADADRWFGQLRDDLNDELECERLSGIIISGDIGNFSVPAEYEAAEVFLERLCGAFKVSADRLVMVPGNHDLNWDISEESYHLIRRKTIDKEPKAGSFYEESKNVIAVRDETAYPERFQHFSQFHETVTAAPYPLDPKTQITLHHLSELNLLIVGFNSVWEADHHFKKRISINPDAVSQALDQIRENPDFKQCLKFAVWHHPLSSPYEDRIKERGFMKRLAQAEFQVCLHGHIHKADAGLFRYDMSADGRRIHVVGAGTFGAPVKEWTSGYPLQYNLLRLSGNTLRVETRRRIELNGTWEPDHLWRQGKGKHNLPYYDIPLHGFMSKFSESMAGSSEAPPMVAPSKTDAALQAEIKTYRRKAESLHENLPVAGFATHLKVPIDIEEIYIPLRAVVNLSGVDELECYGDAREAKKRLEGCDGALEIPLVDAFVQAEQRGRKGLVILGDPGSGKTTHLKRMLLWCLRKGPETLGLPENMLPVFLPLRELKNLTDGLDRFIQDQLASPHLKMRADFGRRLLDRGNLLFLLDGLDEVADEDEREAVSGWIEDAFTDYPDCRFVVSCRFAGYNPDVRMGAKFLEMHVRPLSKEEADCFVRNWYAIVEKSLAKDIEQAASVAEEKADHLIDRLNQSDFRTRRVFELTRNPLLLTNICLVHRHRGTLPQGRARLYDECIEVLLEHWSEAKKLKAVVKAIHGRLALQPAALWLHQEEGRTKASADELAPFIDPVIKEIEWKGGSAKAFLRMIRDRSGLLTGWGLDQFGFMHLGFQEYLAAREIRSRFQQEMNESGRSTMLKELAGHFGESWWQEVALLLLALEDPPLFVPFMREVVRLPAFAAQADLVEMCLDDAVKPSPRPFVELLETRPGKEKEFWRCQMLALRILERLDGGTLEDVMNRLKNHPYDKIQQWIDERFKESVQGVIHPDPSKYELVLIKGGTFMMGSLERSGEKPVHEVTVPDFYMGRYPVTNKEYGRFLTATGYYNEPEYWADRKFNQSQQPVVGVSWYDAKKFAEWAGLQLPTEAQWEYACRAGTKTRYNWGGEPDCSKANYGNSNFHNECKDTNPGKTTPVGDYPPNAWGLYDMHGNVWEWCEDKLLVNYRDAPKDGSAWPGGKKKGARVIRGGAWDSYAGLCRSACRAGRRAAARIVSLGFRLVRLPGEPSEPSKSGE